MAGREGLYFDVDDLSVFGSFTIFAGNKNIMEIFRLGGDDPSVFAEGFISANKMRGVALENTYDTPLWFPGSRSDSTRTTT